MTRWGALFERAAGFGVDPEALREAIRVRESDRKGEDGRAN